MSPTKTTCSLCQQDISTSELRSHQDAERREMVASPLGIIKARHPEWTEIDPTCQLCWDYYKNLPAT